LRGVLCLPYVRQKQKAHQHSETETDANHKDTTRRAAIASLSDATHTDGEACGLTGAKL
jgi:hypothetical protein